MYQIFLSYPRVADERGAVSDIRAHIAREVKIKTGEPDVTVFQDSSGLRGGDQWTEALEEELRSADLLVPFLCPLWLTSMWCRKEFHLYIEFGTKPDVNRPVIPLLWEDTKPHHARDPDQIATLRQIETYQAVPWQSLRHQDSGSEGYRAALSAFADAIANKLLTNYEVIQAVDLENELSKLDLDENSTQLSDEIQKARIKLRHTAQTSPRGAILESWLLLENAAKELGLTENDEPAWKVIPPYLHEKGISISTPSIIFAKLKLLRNQAVHSPDFAVSAEDAEKYLVWATYLADIMKKAH